MENDRKEIFRSAPSKQAIWKRELTRQNLASRTEGFSGAEIASVCNKAALSAVRRGVNSLKGNPDREITILIRRSDIQAALAEFSED